VSSGTEPSTALNCEVEESPTCGALEGFRRKFRLNVIESLAELDRFLDLVLAGSRS
jgi:hypothetical protein